MAVETINTYKNSSEWLNIKIKGSEFLVKYSFMQISFHCYGFLVEIWSFCKNSTANWIYFWLLRYQGDHQPTTFLTETCRIRSYLSKKKSVQKMISSVSYSIVKFWHFYTKKALRHVEADRRSQTETVLPDRMQIPYVHVGLDVN